LIIDRVRRSRAWDEQANMNWAYWVYVFTNFNGRINREPFWIGCAILFAVELAVQGTADQLQNDTLSTVLGLAFDYPEFALALKRGNDRNLSPWLVALFFAGDVALGLFRLINGPIEGENVMLQLVLVPLGLLALALIVELGFRRGTPGPNRFGPDPLSGQA
jgi:uncharacterized membrane protein YhaH (DUF805 family)